MKKMLFICYKKNNTKVMKLNDTDYGCYDNGKVMINVQKIYEEEKDDTEFIEKFSTILLHEYLHMVLEENVREDYLVGEEKVIRKICGEPWNEKLEKQYEADMI